MSRRRVGSKSEAISAARRRAMLAVIAAAGATGVLGAGGCSSEGSAARGAAYTTEPPELVVFAYDRSSSISNHQLGLWRELTDARIAQLDHGDRIAALRILQLSLEEPPERWAQTVPERQFTEYALARDSLMRVRFLRDAQDYLVSYTDSTHRREVNGTDILSSLHDVSAELRAWPHERAVLYLFSDMLQADRGMNMEGLARMPPSNWVEREQADGTLPDLSGLCVVVIGARVDTDASQRVKRFWDEYFEATGAVFREENYMLRPVELPRRPCAGGDQA